MADDAQTLRRIDWREVFPFTHLFRAFRIAVHPSKLVLGLVLLLLLYTGGRVLDGLWPRQSMAPSGELAQYENIRWQNDRTRCCASALPQVVHLVAPGAAQENASAYAQLLMQAHLAPDEKAGHDAADDAHFSTSSRSTSSRNVTTRSPGWRTTPRSDSTRQAKTPTLRRPGASGRRRSDVRQRHPRCSIKDHGQVAGAADARAARPIHRVFRVRSPPDERRGQRRARGQLDRRVPPGRRRRAAPTPAA